MLHKSRLPNHAKLVEQIAGRCKTDVLDFIQRTQPTVDEAAGKGDNAGALAALRALILRFPDHPLAATAAKQTSIPQ